ncbi:MAG: transposase [Akkermansiaceae bacterium]|jgi:transposase-like protein
MTSKTKSSRKDNPDNPQTTESSQAKRGRPPNKITRRPSKTFSPEQKAQAVLAAWTEKVSQSEICRQMQINYMTFQHWQDRAMEGMLRALENQMKLEDTAVLSPRLRKMMERGRRGPEDRLGRRLLQIQQERDNNPPV